MSSGVPYFWQTSFWSCFLRFLGGILTTENTVINACSSENRTPCSVTTSKRAAHRWKDELELYKVMKPDQSARWKVRLCWLVHSAIDENRPPGGPSRALIPKKEKAVHSTAPLLHFFSRAAFVFLLPLYIVAFVQRAKRSGPCATCRVRARAVACAPGAKQNEGSEHRGTVDYGKHPGRSEEANSYCMKTGYLTDRSEVRILCVTLRGGPRITLAGDSRPEISECRGECPCHVFMV